MQGAGGTVIFITGRDIVVEGKGGLSSYVRAHALAARRLGYRTHVFFLGDRDDGRETPYGRLHTVRNPLLPARWIRARGDRGQEPLFTAFMNRILKTSYTARMHAAFLGPVIKGLIRSCHGPVVIHTTYVWGSVACRIRDEMAAEGRRVKAVNSVFTTMRHEIAGKLKGARKSGDIGVFLSTCVEWCWMRLFGLSSERRSLESSDLVLYNYDSVRRLFEAEYGVITHARRIGYTIEGAFQENSEKDDTPRIPSLRNSPPIISSVSRHDPRKGVDTLIRALSVLASRGVTFRARIGSGGELLPWHRRLADQLGLSGIVEFTGWMEDPGEIYRTCDVFVLPSLEEGSGSVSLLEALMHGNCIVASAIDGIPEDVRHGQEALLVPPADPVALADALEKLLQDADLRSRMGDAAKARFMELFHPDRFVSDLGKAYAEA